MAEIVINNSYYTNMLDNLIDDFYSLDATFKRVYEA